MIAATLDRDGRTVVLDEQARRHIRSEHPELSPYLREIMAAVREPDRQMTGHEPGELWYYAERTTRFPWLRVVVHYERGEGWRVTAFARTELP